MNYNQIFDTQIFNPVKAEKFGFKMNQEDCYEWETLLEGYDLILTVVIGKQQCNIRVLTLPDREPYELFEVVSSEGPFVTEIRNKVADTLYDIRQQCFDSKSTRDAVLSYCADMYNTKPENPWDKYPAYCTLKTAKSDKWYAIVMDIPQSSLGLDSKAVVDVLNVKVNPERIKELIDYQHFFPAYHMNKKYWISILLDHLVDMKLVQKLIDESYGLVEK